MSKLTKEQLHGMSDFEVNKVLAELVMMALKKETWTFNNNKDKVQFFDEKTQKCRVVDYCNTPNDIMPLAFEHKICIDWFSDGRCLAMFGGLNEDFNYQSTNPLRAIACCLILVLQEKS